MSQCNTCKNYSTCNDKDRESIQRYEAFGIDVKCSGYEYQKPLTQEEFRELFRKGLI
jgi:hypothetical protein